MILNITVKTLVVLVLTVECVTLAMQNECMRIDTMRLFSHLLPKVKIFSSGVLMRRTRCNFKGFNNILTILELFCGKSHTRNTLLVQVFYIYLKTCLEGMFKFTLHLSCCNNHPYSSKMQMAFEDVT